MIAWDMKVGIDRRRKSLAILKSSSMIHCLLFVQGVVVATLKIFPAAVEVFKKRNRVCMDVCPRATFLLKTSPSKKPPTVRYCYSDKANEEGAFFKGRVKIEPQRGYFRGVKQKRIFLISF